MRHYEIMFLLHPDQSEQAASMLERYQTLVKKNNGQIHRVEDWGRRQLAYPIKKLHKAHYLLLNIESDAATLKEITTSFRFNDAILRNLVLQRKTAITQPSAMFKQKDKKPVRELFHKEHKEASVTATTLNDETNNLN